MMSSDYSHHIVIDHPYNILKEIISKLQSCICYVLSLLRKLSVSIFPFLITWDDAVHINKEAHTLLCQHLLCCLIVYITWCQQRHLLYNQHITCYTYLLILFQEEGPKYSVPLKIMQNSEQFFVEKYPTKFALDQNF